MKYMKQLPRIILVLVTAFSLESCSKYLDVQPEDRFLDEQVYGNKTSVRNVLNGIYLNLAKPALYGRELSAASLDVMAQYYSITTTKNTYFNTISYQYADAAVRGRNSTIWGSAFTAILNINLFITNVEASENVLPQTEKDIVLGEAYALRALLAFDMLRLFGPIYAIDSSKTAIPYPTAPDSKAQSLLPASSVINNVIADLEKAGVLLEKDPIRSEGVKALDTGSDNFFRLRNRRMNYYAVKALTARVLLYRRDNNGAKFIATAVIEEASKWFPWSPTELSAAGIESPDRIFSSELFFGLENRDMYTNQTSFFAANLLENILMPLPQRLSETYDNFENDYRLRVNFAVDRSSTRTDKTFFKYADITDKSLLHRFLQPMIRLSELYYIAIEAETDELKAEALLNTVRRNRGLPPITIDGNKRALVTQEYKKEFWGEGQLFYYYKRLNLPTIPNGTSANAVIEMNAARYVVPLPLSETSFR